MANVLGRAAQMGILFSRGPGAILRGIMQTKMGITDISKLTLPQFRQALSLLLTDPKYGVAGMAQKIATTFTGLKSMISDSIVNIKLELAKAGLFDEAKAFLEVIRQFLKSEKVIKYFRQIGEIGGEAIKKLREKFVELIETGKIDEWFKDWVRNIKKLRDMFFKFLENLPKLGTWLSNMMSGMMIGLDKLLSMLNGIVKTVDKIALIKVRMDLDELRDNQEEIQELIVKGEKLRNDISERGAADRIKSYGHEFNALAQWNANWTEEQKKQIIEIEKAYFDKDNALKSSFDTNVNAYEKEKAFINETLKGLYLKRNAIIKEKGSAKELEGIYEDGFYIQGTIIKQMEDLGSSLKNVFVNAKGEIEGMKNEIIDVGEATADLFPAMRDPIKTITEQWEDFIDSIKESGEKMRDVTQQIAEGMMGEFKDLFFDAMKGELKSLGDYFKSFVNMISEIIAQQLAMKTAMGIMGLFQPSPVLGGVPATAAPPLAGLSPVTIGQILGSGRMGGGYAPRRAPAEYATGGIVKARGGYPRGGDTIPILASEGEMILNKRQQSNLVSMLDKGGRGGGNVSINVNVSSLDGADTFRVLSRNADAIGAILQKGMINRNRGF